MAEVSKELTQGKLCLFLKYIFLTLVSFSFSYCNQHENRTCEKIVEKYSKIVESKDLQDTLGLMEILNTAIIKDTFCFNAYLMRAELKLKSGFKEQAIEDFLKASFLDTNNIYVLYKVGVLYQENEKDDLALFYLKKAIQKKTIGNAIIDRPINKNGVNSEINKYDIDATELLYREGVSFYYKKELQSAYDNFNFCIKNNYQLKESYLYRGSLFLETNQKGKACQDFFEAKRLGNNEADKFIEQYCR